MAVSAAMFGSLFLGTYYLQDVRGLLMSRLDRTSGSLVTGCCFLLLGAGFVAVMVTATAVLVRASSVAAAGVSGGLQQTATNVGPMLGVALATVFRPADVSTTGVALLVLAAVEALGALPATGPPATSDDGRPAVRV